MKSMKQSIGERPPFGGGRDDTSKRGSQCKGRVDDSPFTDDNGDAGMYTGETNEYGYPHGEGQSMKMAFSSRGSGSTVRLWTQFLISHHNITNMYSFMIININCLQVSGMAVLRNVNDS
jgi:hypothetical protein